MAEPRPDVRVYIGGGDNDPGAFDGFLAAPDRWSFVRANVNGYYINNFALRLDGIGFGGLIQEPKLSQMAGLFANKAAFYETDWYRDLSPGGDTSDGRRYNDKRRIDFLRLYFNEVTCASIAIGGFEAIPEAELIVRMGSDGLKWRFPRPVLALQGPWDIGGDINANNVPAANERLGIHHGQGCATDGPMGEWAVNRGEMRTGSFSMVRYAHSLGKIAMVMLAPYDPAWDPNLHPGVVPPSPDDRGLLFLERGQDCVRQHEANNAIPDVWVISYYAAQITTFPVTPEANPDGSPAGTITGLVYWLIHHLRDPVNWP